MSASEAVYGFVAWLSSRKEKTVMSSKHNCLPLVELISQFVRFTKLTY